MNIKKSRNLLIDYALEVKANPLNTNKLTQDVYNYVQYIIQQAVTKVVGTQPSLNQVSLDELKQDILLKVISPEYINMVKTDRIRAYQQYIYVTASNEVRTFLRQANNRAIHTNYDNNLMEITDNNPITYLSGSTGSLVADYLTTYVVNNQIYMNKKSGMYRCYLELIDYVRLNDTTQGFINYAQDKYSYAVIRLLISKLNLNIKLF